MCAAGVNGKSIGMSALPVTLPLVCVAILSSGCAFHNKEALANARSVEPCQRADALVREAQADMAALRAEMASTRIAAAKKEAELLELRRQVEDLRAAAAEAKLRQAEQRQSRESMDRRQAKWNNLSDQRDRSGPPQTTSQSPKVQEQVKALEASVLALTAQLEALKAQRRDKKHKDGGLSTDAFPIIVKRGDTLPELAGTYGVTVREIQAANGLQSDLILAGQQLWIPAGKASAARP